VVAPLGLAARTVEEYDDVDAEAGLFERRYSRRKSPAAAAAAAAVEVDSNGARMLGAPENSPPDDDPSPPRKATPHPNTSWSMSSSLTVLR
jgi:hypothetical protein